jgi:hypothetical protein
LVEVCPLLPSGRFAGSAPVAGGASDNSDNVEFAIDTSIATGHNHARSGDIPNATTRSRSASNDNTNAQPANAIVIASAHQYMNPTRRARTSRATECVEPNKTAGGTTAAAAASRTVPPGAVNTACATLPATDTLVAMVNQIQKNRVAPRVDASLTAVSVVIDSPQASPPAHSESDPSGSS